MERKDHKEECFTTRLYSPYYSVLEQSQDTVIFMLLFPCRSVISVVQFPLILTPDS